MTHKEKARENFLKGYNCAQAVFVAFSDVTGLSLEQAFLISSSFGGGMGHTGEACGAVTGMYMAAGMIFGYNDPTNTEAKNNHYKLIKKLSDEFKKEFSSKTRCPELLANLSKGEYFIPDADEYKKRPCLIFVEKAAEILENLL